VLKLSPNEIAFAHVAGVFDKYAVASSSAGTDGLIVKVNLPAFA